MELWALPGDLHFLRTLTPLLVSSRRLALRPILVDPLIQNGKTMLRITTFPLLRSCKSSRLSTAHVNSHF